MAKFSFYHSQRWEKLRQYIIDRDGGMCVHCGGKGNIAHHKIWIDDMNCNSPSVVWNPDNLECVCVDCHAAIHSKTGARPTADGYRFDDEGNLIYIGEENNTDEVEMKNKRK